MDLDANPKMKVLYFGFAILCKPWKQHAPVNVDIVNAHSRKNISLFAMLRPTLGHICLDHPCYLLVCLSESLLNTPGHDIYKMTHLSFYLLIMNRNLSKEYLRILSSHRISLQLVRYQFSYINRLFLWSYFYLTKIVNILSQGA